MAFYYMSIELLLINMQYLIPSASNIETAISLMKLDLVIKACTCFYNSLTEYAKTYLQFTFPLYLLFMLHLLLQVDISV